MPYYRDPVVQAAYDKLPKGDENACPFCNLDPSRKILEESDTYYIVANLMPYDLWDMHKVDEHLLLVPKKHISSIAELSEASRAEIMEALSSYEEKGYNIYARAAQNKTKSVTHQHTHLIKTSGPTLIAMEYKDKPYTRKLEFSVNEN